MPADFISVIFISEINKNKNPKPPTRTPGISCTDWGTYSMVLGLCLKPGQELKSLAQRTSDVAQARTESLSLNATLRSIGRSYTNRNPVEASGSFPVVYNFLLLSAFSGNLSVFIEVWSKVTQLHYIIAGFLHKQTNPGEDVKKNYGKIQL